MTYATARGDPSIVNALLRAGADPNHANETGWTALMAAVNQGKVSCAIALIKAGADLEAECEPRRRTPLVLAIENSPRMIPILLRAGARLDMNRITQAFHDSRQWWPSRDWAPLELYLEKVDAAGGWKKYEQPHRKRLTTMFTRVLFPHLPIAAISNIVYFWAHVGFY